MAHFCDRLYLTVKEREIFRKLRRDQPSADFTLYAGYKKVKVHKVLLLLRSVGNEVKWRDGDEFIFDPDFEMCLSEFLDVLYEGRPPGVFMTQIKAMWKALELAKPEDMFLLWQKSDFRKDFGKINDVRDYYRWLDEMEGTRVEDFRAIMLAIPRRERFIPPQIEPLVAEGYFQASFISQEQREKIKGTPADFPEVTYDLTNELYKFSTQELAEGVNWATELCKGMFMRKGRWSVPARSLNPHRTVDKMLVFDATHPVRVEEKALFVGEGKWIDSMRNHTRVAALTEGRMKRKDNYRLMLLRGYPVPVGQLHQNIMEQIQKVGDANGMPYFSISKLRNLLFSYASVAHVEALPLASFDFLPQWCRLCGSFQHIWEYCSNKGKSQDKKIQSASMLRVMQWVDERSHFLNYHRAYMHGQPLYEDDDPLRLILTIGDKQDAPFTHVYYERVRIWLTGQGFSSFTEYYEWRYRELGVIKPDVTQLPAMREVDDLVWERTENMRLLENLQELEAARAEFLEGEDDWEPPIPTVQVENIAAEEPQAGPSGCVSRQ